MDTDSASTLFGRNPSYDAAGNVAQDGANTYLYDAEGRICAVQSLLNNSPIIGYLYDAEGTRIAKGTRTSWNCDNSGNNLTITTSYILGPDNEQLAELTWSGGTAQPVHTNVWAGGQLAATFDNSDPYDEPAGILYFHLSDWLGSRRVLTDSNGVVAQVCHSLPYGNGEDCIPPAATEHLFTGKERDAESGNDYFKYRYYASSMGRWLSPDPSGLTHADLGNPQSLNLYNYVGNRPLTIKDLDGLCWQGFQWACNIIQRFENRFSGYGFQTNDQILSNPNQRSQKKIKQKREESRTRESQPAQSLLANSAYQFSGFAPVHTTTVVVPIDAVPVPIPIFSIGVTTSVTWIPKTNTWCLGPSATLASGGGKAFSATMYGSTDAQYTKGVISGWGATLNAQPSELGGISVSSNSSGVLTGYTIATDAGVSGAWGYTKCADF